MERFYLFVGCIFLWVSMLQGCTGRSDLAPVVDVNWRQNNPSATKHIVSKGETLYSIAFRYDKDYRALASINHIKYPYILAIGQPIYLQSDGAPKHRVTKSLGVKASAPVLLAAPQRDSSGGKWVRPAQGKVVTYFAPAHGKKGIDIEGKKGHKVFAAIDGVVAYAGNGLAGYGNLIIIKHDNRYLTAYANNARTFVKEGQSIKKGQVIAEMGLIDRRYWGVHFEVRKSGKPVNPLHYVT